ncbi:MAG: acyl-CoA/acyl-ACP dehydrogenase [Dehalococcoidales bacterium]|jgi:alkylation response protein AidB-like acyl-CoA dehydrogenase|nr:acyl-CoA/acyl-ACP dehydrogenase [Dehalococcoidales bacterium]
MDFDFTEEQRMFRDALQDFMQREYGPIVDKRDREGPFTREEEIEINKKFQAIGIGIDPENMKAYLDPTLFGIMSEEMSKVWASLTPLLGMGAIPAIYVPLASDDMKSRVLPRLEKGEFVGAFAETEPEAGCDTRDIQTTARLEGDYYIVNGTKTWISNAVTCDTAFVGVKDPETGAQTFLLIEKEVSPWETSPLHKIGWNASDTGEMFFDNCKVPKENEMGAILKSAFEKGQTLPISEGFMKLFTTLTPTTALLTLPRAGMGLMSVGIAQAAFEASVKYAKERVTFGKPIGKHQLIQNMLYEMNLLIETARLLGYKAIDTISKGDPDARRLSSMAKVYGGESAVKVTYHAIQIHGANGLSQELPLERYFRDARMQTIPDGTSEMMKLISTYTILGKGFSAYA